MWTGTPALPGKIHYQAQKFDGHPSCFALVLGAPVGEFYFYQPEMLLSPPRKKMTHTQVRRSQMQRTCATAFLWGWSRRLLVSLIARER